MYIRIKGEAINLVVPKTPDAPGLPGRDASNPVTKVSSRATCKVLAKVMEERARFHVEPSSA